MTDIERQLREDRMLRRAARRLVQDNAARLRGELSPASLSRLAKAGSAELVDTAAGLARQHRLGLGTGLAVGLAAWLAWQYRDQLADAVHALANKFVPDDGDRAESESETPDEHP